MTWVEKRVAKCDECGYEWIPEVENPSQCPSRKCRKRTWNKNGDGKLGTENNLAETLEKVKAFESRLPQVSVQERSERPKRPRARNVSIPKPEPLETLESEEDLSGFDISSDELAEEVAPISRQNCPKKEKHRSMVSCSICGWHA